jgi:hypothetical protein
MQYSRIQLRQSRTVFLSFIIEGSFMLILLSMNERSARPHVRKDRGLKSRKVPDEPLRLSVKQSKLIKPPEVGNLRDSRPIDRAAAERGSYVNRLTRPD